MGPPPAPNSLQHGSAVAGDTKLDMTDDAASHSPKILQPEIKALRECLIDSAATIAQIINYHTDIYKIGIQRQAPKPPSGLIESWKRNAETYEDILDDMETQVQRALDAVEYQIEQENEKLKHKQQAEALQRSQAAAAGSRKPSSMFIDIPRFDEKSIDPLSVHPEFRLKNVDGNEEDLVMQDGTTEEPASMEGVQEDNAGKLAVPSGAAVPKDSGLARASRSSISLTSLNRHGLKLDLSTLTLDGLAENKSGLAPSRMSTLGPSGMSGVEPMGSPVTLAPKSAKPRPGFDGDFNPLALSDIQLNSLLTGTGMDDLFGDNETSDANIGVDALFSNPLIQPIKSEDISNISLIGDGQATTSGGQEKLFEDLAFESSGANNGSTALTNTEVPLGGDMSAFSFDMGSELPRAQGSEGITTAIGGSEAQQLQQRQQFGIDLNLPSALDSSAAQFDPKLLELLGSNTASTQNAGDANAAGLPDFTLDLFGPNEGTSTDVDTWNTLFPPSQ